MTHEQQPEAMRAIAWAVIHSNDMVLTDSSGVADAWRKAGLDVLSLAPVQASTESNEPALHQFQDQDGSWHNFISEQHKLDTIAAGYRVRPLYAVPPAFADAAVHEAWRELSRRLYVELFNCDQQMMQATDEEGEPMWQQGSTVRDVLRDAKAALAAASAQAQGAPECLTCSDHGAVGNILTAEPCPDCTPATAAGAARGLADRVRAGVEAAPWVCAAIANQDAELARLRAALAAAAEPSSAQEALTQQFNAGREFKAERANASLSHFFDEWEQVLPADVREAIRRIAKKGGA